MASDYVPRFIVPTSFSPFNEQFYLLCVGENEETKLQISSFAKLLLEEVDGVRNISSITESFNGKCSTDFSVENIMTVFQNQLSGYGILADDSREKIIVKDQYLSLRFILIPYPVVRSVTKCMKFLFSERVFVTLFIINAVFLSIVFIREINVRTVYNDLSPALITYFLLVNIVSIIFHEFGHAAACERFGAKGGSIGFGFYIFTPVFYADVTDAWRLSKWRRLIVDLAGIYIQLICCSFLVLSYFLLGNPVLLYIAFFIASTVLLNIDPFLRYDGYWALSDILDIPNLREKSNRAVLSLRSRMAGKSKPDFSAKDIFLIIYGLCSWAFMLYFFVYMVVLQHDSVLYFPKNIAVFIYSIYIKFPDVSFDWIKDNLSELTLPFIFYFFVIRILIRKTKLSSLFKF